jgi:hypothetical protein
LLKAYFEITSRNFWNEIKCINAKKTSFADSVDGNYTQQGISDLFAAKYQQLYSSVPFEAAKIDAVKRCIDERISACPYDSGYAISAREVSMLFQN